MNVLKDLTADSLAQYFDHTQLHAEATEKDFIKLCEESKKYHFRMVAINSAPVALCKGLLKIRISMWGPLFLFLWDRPPYR